MKTLLDYLKEYANSGFYPMHMPGHKRSPSLSLPNPYSIDITEIEGFDNLHHAEGILKQGMERTAALYGSRQSFHLVNGSTVGILAGILSATQKGDKVLVARNGHKAVYHALILNELNPVYILPEYDESFGIHASISPQNVNRLLEENPDIKLVILTSPTYEGILSDIKSISDLCHEKGATLLVDEAHGAHLGFHSPFPASAVYEGADIVVQSLHKTLPSLTQTAVLHLCSDRITAEKVRRKLAMLETSSPSYVLMASIESCISMLTEHQEELFSAWAEKIDAFNQEANKLEKLRIFGYGKERSKENTSCYAFDPSKLVISTKGTAFSGLALADYLRKEHQIEPEMVSSDYIIAMTSLCDSEEGYTRLAKALFAADKKAVYTPKKPAKQVFFTPEKAMLPFMVQQHEEETVPFLASAGRITAEFVFAYPPGIPILAPGEKVSTEIINHVETLIADGVNIEIGGKSANEIAVIKQ